MTVDVISIQFYQPHETLDVGHFSGGQIEDKNIALLQRKAFKLVHYSPIVSPYTEMFAFYSQVWTKWYEIPYNSDDR